MNTTHLLAWIACLALAFFACILSVRNTGNVIQVRGQVQALEEEVGAMDEAEADVMTGESARIQKSLENIADEIHGLRTSMEGRGPVEKLVEKLQRLEDEVKQLKAEMPPAQND